MEARDQIVSVITYHRSPVPGDSITEANNWPVVFCDLNAVLSAELNFIFSRILEGEIYYIPSLSQT
jgi:hypothetical protein